MLRSVTWAAAVRSGLAARFSLARGLRDYDLCTSGPARRMVTSDGAIDLYPGRGLWMRPGRRYEAEQDASARLAFRSSTSGCDPAAHARRVRIRAAIEVFETRYPDYFNAALAHVTRTASRSEIPLETGCCSSRSSSKPPAKRKKARCLRHRPALPRAMARTLAISRIIRLPRWRVGPAIGLQPRPFLRVFSMR